MNIRHKQILFVGSTDQHCNFFYDYSPGNRNFAKGNRLTPKEIASRGMNFFNQNTHTSYTVRPINTDDFPYLTGYFKFKNADVVVYHPNVDDELQSRIKGWCKADCLFTEYDPDICEASNFFDNVNKVNKELISLANEKIQLLYIGIQRHLPFLRHLTLSYLPTEVIDIIARFYINLEFLWNKDYLSFSFFKSPENLRKPFSIKNEMEKERKHQQIANTILAVKKQKLSIKIQSQIEEYRDRIKNHESEEFNFSRIYWKIRNVFKKLDNGQLWRDKITQLQAADALLTDKKVETGILTQGCRLGGYDADGKITNTLVEKVRILKGIPDDVYDLANPDKHVILDKNAFIKIVNKIETLSIMIKSRIELYKGWIEKEKNAFPLFQNKDKIILWEKKIAVLTVANRLIKGKAEAQALLEAELANPGWSDGTVALALAGKVKKRMGIPLDWDGYEPKENIQQQQHDARNSL